jgi:amino acid permease
MTILLLFTVGLIVGQSTNFIHLANYKIVDWKYFLLPYGAMLFALDGAIVLPIIVELLKKDKDKVRKVIAFGAFVPAIVTAIFALIVVGITGADTTEDALAGVRAIVSDGVIVFALVFGTLCLTTSFLGTAQSLIRVFNIDYKLNRNLSWLLALAVPYMFYLMGVTDLTKVISFAGAVSGGFVAIILMMIGKKINEHPRKGVLFKHRLPIAIYYSLFAMFVAGIFYEIFGFILK